MNPVSVVRARGGAARWKEIREAGVTARALRTAVEAGVLFRFHPGCYCLPGTPGAIRAAVLFRGQVACVSALELGGVALLTPPTKPHIVVPTHRSLGRPGVRPVDRAIVHYADRGADLIAHPSSALDDAAMCLEPLAHLCALESALNRGFITFEEVEWLWRREPLRGAWLRRHMTASSESVAETLAKYALESDGFVVRSQVRLGPDGRRDLVVLDSIVIEVDGYETHGNKRSFVVDRRLDRNLRADGLEPLRFAAVEVLEDPKVVPRAVRA